MTRNMSLLRIELCEWATLNLKVLGGVASRRSLRDCVCRHICMKEGENLALQ